MSHTAERKEKNCLNCGTIVQGRYCQNCGQENIVPKETFWHMFTHFFYDITHFDTSFFHTIHHLILRPGFLSQEYMIGRRASYPHPIKMYVFSSALFFLLFFSLFKPGDAEDINTDLPLDSTQRAVYLISLQNRLKKDTGNTILQEKFARAKDSSKILKVSDTLTKKPENFSINFGDKDYKTFAVYDSVQQTLPPAERNGWLSRRIIKRGIEINNKYKDNPDEAITKLFGVFFHRLPYLLFVSLPLFALILKLVYVRRKQYYYADHGVFTIHLYVFSFILLMVVFGIDKLKEITGWKFMEFITAVLFIWLVSYLYVAMRKFYKQGWFKTFVKFLLVSLLSLLMMVLLFVIFLIFSVANI